MFVLDQFGDEAAELVRSLLILFPMVDERFSTERSMPIRLCSLNTYAQAFVQQGKVLLTNPPFNRLPLDLPVITTCQISEDFMVGYRLKISRCNIV